MTGGRLVALLVSLLSAVLPAPESTSTVPPHQVRRSLDIRDFGATPDDATDDTAAIQSALDAAAFAGGGTVLVPAGTYLLSPVLNVTWLRVASNTTIQGIGSASVLKVRDEAGDYSRLIGQHRPDAIVSNVLIRDLRIDQNSPGNHTGVVQLGKLETTQFAILFTAFNGVEVDHLFVDNAAGVNTIVLNGTAAKGARVRDSRIRFAQGISREYDNSAIYIHGTDFVVEGNTIESAGSPGRAIAAIEVHGGPGLVSGNRTAGYVSGLHVVSRGGGESVARPSDIVVIGNTFTGANSGINLWALTGHTLVNVSVIGNAISIANVTYKANAHAGIRLWNDAVTGAVAGDFEGLVISSNTIQLQSEERAGYAFSQSGGIVLAPQGSIRGLVVSGNVIRDAPTHGIRLQSYLGSVREALLNGNVVVNAGNNSKGGGYRIGIGLFGLVTESRVSGNLVTSTNAAAGGSYAWHFAGLSAGSDVQFLDNGAQSSGPGLRSAFSSRVHRERREDLAFSTSVVPDAAAASHFTITATSGIAFTIEAVINAVSGQRILLRLRNPGDSSLGAVRFAPEYKLAGPWVSPKPGAERLIEFEFDGTRWWEISRSAADISSD